MKEQLPTPTGTDAFPLVTPLTSIEAAMQSYRDRHQGLRSLTDRNERAVRAIGLIARIRGPVLYNPFGGVDLPFQFGLSDEITDVVSQGAEAFGHPHDVQQSLGTARPPEMTLGYDSSMTLSDRMRTSREVGALVFARLHGMGARPLSLHYFSLDPSGNISFGEGEDSAVITFEKDRGVHRFWYVQQTFQRTAAEYRPGAFEAFIGKHAFHSLLIKAAENWWNPMMFNPEAVMLGVLDPSRALGIPVLSDNNISDCEMAPNERPMWDKMYTPAVIGLGAVADIGKVKRIGYSEDYLVTGNSQHLTDRHDSRYLAAMDARRSGEGVMLGR